MTVLAYAIPPLLVFLLLIAQRSSKKHSAPLPPGPKPLPLIGNAHQFPLKDSWRTFTKWKEEHGEIVYVNILGQEIIVLNSRQAAAEIMEKRSAASSDRPHMAMLCDLVGFTWSISLMPYSARWRQHRRIFSQFFNEKAARAYHPVQEQCIHSLLYRLLQDPARFLEHTRLTFGQSILKVVYDINVKSSDDEMISMVEKAVDGIVQTQVPGRYMVDAMPFLKYVPEWMPGAGFKKVAAERRKMASDAKELPAAYVEKKIMREGASPSVYSSMLEQCKDDSEAKQLSEDPAVVAKNCAAIAYFAGADTTTSSAQAFYLAMANYPDVQRAAQEELDRVVGNNRLPTFDDMKDLPYICALLKELLRWHIVVPAGSAHTLSEDIMYEGYVLPKGALVIPNAGWLLRDPEIYPDPHQFKPSRWLMETPQGVKINPDIPEPDAGFGFGRRICPGRYFAQNGLFMMIASILACFNISPLDESGIPCNSIPENFSDGVMVYPLPFKAALSPRSAGVAQLLRDVVV